jgi:hypothetical protein
LGGGIIVRTRSIKPPAAALFAAAVAGVGLLVSGQPAFAAAPVAAGLSISPSAITVGSNAQVLATATNNTTGAVDASMGVNVPSGFSVTGVSGTNGCTPRNLTRLVYCGVQGLAPGGTATITFTVTPTGTGSFKFQSYARVTSGTANDTALATLTVS